MNVKGLEINSPEYWEIRHKREDWPRTSSWATDLLSEIIPEGSTVLEVGCGQGAASIYLATKRPDLKIKGFDISSTAIKKATDSQIVNTEFTVADVFKLKHHMPNMAYDYVFSIQNFEHWEPETHIEAFRQIWSRIRPGGKLFLTGVGRSWDLGIMNNSPMLWNGEIIQAPNDLHYNNWSEQDIYDLAMTQKARSVKFFRLRGKDRVVAEAEKSS